MRVPIQSLLVTAALLLLVCPSQAVTLPFLEDFESGNGSFSTATMGGWVWGTPTSAAGPATAYSGTKVWGTNLVASYSPNLNAALVSPVYDLSAEAGKHILLHWWQHLVTEETHDRAEVQVSKNSGGTWETVFGPRQGMVNPEWTQHTVLLDPSYATDGFRVRFRMMTDSSVADGGFFVDDLRISSASFSPAAPAQDFELNDGSYVSGGTRSSWQYGSLVTAPGSAKSGQSVWATNLNGFYNSDENSTLTAPTMDLSASAGKLLAVTWWQYLLTESGYDFFEAEVSSNNGATWSVAGSWSGDVSPQGWARRQIFIGSEYATAQFRLRFRLRSDAALQYHGVALDDISVLATSGLKPTTGPITKSAPENHPIAFTESEFKAAYADPDGGPFSGIRVVTLPVSGLLTLGGNPVALNDSIPASALGTLSYEPPAGATGSWFFDYEASNHFSKSNPGRVTLNILGPTPQVVITSPPAGVTVNPGTSVTFTVVAVSSQTMNYEWRRNGATLVSGPSASYTLSPVTETQEGDYDVVVSNSQSSVTSAVAVLSVNDPVTFTSEPGNDSVVEGGSKTFSVVAAGTGRLDYLWFKNDIPLPTEISSSLTISNALESSGGIYRCEVTNIVGTKSTQPFVVSVLLAPRIVKQPAPLGLRLGRRAVFSVEVAGAGPFTYQWFKDGIEVPGAIGPVLEFASVKPTNIGNYTVKVSNSWAERESLSVRLFVMPWIDVVGIYQDILERPDAPSGETTCPGRVTLNLRVYGFYSGTLTYDGKYYPFRGRLSDSLVSEHRIRRPNKSPLLLKLELDAENRTMSALLSHDETGGSVQSHAVMPRIVYHPRNNPSPQEGRYTVVLEPDLTVIGTPLASGYLHGSVSKGGLARFAGRLPQGSTFTFSSNLQATGRIALHKMIKQRGRLVSEFCGRIGFDPQSGGGIVIDGGLVWKNMPRPTQILVPTPFVAMLEANGSLYTRPVTPELILSLPQGSIMYKLVIEGSFGAPLERWLRIDPGNAVIIDPLTDANIRVSFNERLGLVRGSFIDVVTGKRFDLNGVVNEAAQSMGGLVKRGNITGRFTVVPRL